MNFYSFYANQITTFVAVAYTFRNFLVFSEVSFKCLKYCFKFFEVFSNHYFCCHDRTGFNAINLSVADSNNVIGKLSPLHFSMLLFCCHAENCETFPRTSVTSVMNEQASNAQARERRHRREREIKISERACANERASEKVFQTAPEAFMLDRITKI